MKTFDIAVQMRPWYGSPYYTLEIEARNLASALKKAIKQRPDGVWYWYKNEVVYTNQARMDHFRKLNPDVVFDHA